MWNWIWTGKVINGVQSEIKKGFAVENLQGAIFAEINEQLAKKSLHIKAGTITIVDASVIQAQRTAATKIKTETIHKILKRITT